MRKILVTGNAGSGKSTLSKRLGKMLDIAVYSLDTIVWGPGWKKIPKEERQSKIDKLLHNSSWIIDGVSLEIAKEADTIVFLDFPRRLCYWRAFKRNWKYLFRSRPELPENCPEIRIISTLVKIIWNFPARVRPLILEQIEESRLHKNIIHIRTSKEYHQAVSMLNIEISPKRR